jgi:hypothetical protein
MARGEGARRSCARLAGGRGEYAPWWPTRGGKRPRLFFTEGDWWAWGGTGSELVDAVATVLKAAGLTVTDLDELLGDTSSADLLVSNGSDRRLVEVKSAGGNAAEKLVAALDRHLQTWPAMRPSEPVSGGVLVVNHQHKLDPAERSAEVFSRPEFVATLTVTVLSSRQVFDWWRASDWESIRGAVMGRAAHRATTAAPDEAVPPPTTPRAQQGPWPRWFQRWPR